MQLCGVPNSQVSVYEAIYVAIRQYVKATSLILLPL